MKIETKFDIGDEVWYFSHITPIKAEKSKIKQVAEYSHYPEITWLLEAKENPYGAKDAYHILRKEDELFKTKEELKNSL